MKQIIHTTHFQFSFVEFNIEAENILLCFPGLGSTGYDFEQLSLFMPEFHFIAIDLFGHGNTSSLSEYSESIILDALDELINHLQINHFYVLGHSYGAAIAFLLTLHHKEKIIKCISIDGGYHHFPAIYEYVRQHSELSMLAKSEEEEAIQTRKMIEEECYVDMDEVIHHYHEMLPMMSINNIKNMVVFKDGKYISHVNPLDAEKVIHFMNQFSHDISLKDFSNTDITILISSLPEIMDELRMAHANRFQKISSCRIMKIENSYHAMHVMEPERIGNILNSLLFS